MVAEAVTVDATAGSFFVVSLIALGATGRVAPSFFSHCTVGLTVALPEVKRYFREPRIDALTGSRNISTVQFFSGAEVMR